MQKSTFKISNLTTDERCLFKAAFGITTEQYALFLGRSARSLCETDEEYDRKWALYYSYLKKLSEGYSVASIIGRKDFYEHTFFVNENVLIPRPETEELVEKCIELIETDFGNSNEKNYKDTFSVLDMCTGSGCIGLSIYLHFLNKGVHIKTTLEDISDKALEVCEKNLEAFLKTYMKTNNFDIRNDVSIIKSDLFASLSLKEKFNLIVSNPPYVRESDYEKLDTCVRKEPKIALTAGEDGLDVIKKLVDSSPYFLKENGTLIFEHGLNQEKEIGSFFKKAQFPFKNAHFSDIVTYKDLTGRPRFTKGEFRIEP